MIFPITLQLKVNSSKQVNACFSEFFLAGSRRKTHQLLHIFNIALEPLLPLFWLLCIY